MAGSFTNAGGNGAGYLASLASNCPATAVPFGSGYAGSAGLLGLAATSLPWLGGRCDARATGLAPNAMAFGLVGLGFGPATTPLAAIHPAGGAGCTAYTTPIAAQWLASRGGAAVWGFALPLDPSFVGVMLRQQGVSAELDAAGALVLLSSSNALDVTLGAW